MSRIPLTPEKQKRLLEFLGALPTASAVKLFAALERERASGGEGLPYDLLLEELRGRLKARHAAFPARPKSAQRLFYAPFEDFFISCRTGKKRRARIARASLSPIWSVMMNDPACAGAARAARALDGALASGASAPGEIARLEEALFNAAGQGLSRLAARAQAEPAFQEGLVKLLGGEPALADLGEIYSLLAIVEQLKAMQRAFPKPVGGLTESQFYRARELHGEARGVAPEAAPYVLLGLMARMGEPWRALPLYHHLAASSDVASGRDAALIVDTLFDDLENEARLLEEEASGAFDAEAAAFHAAHFADLADGVAKEAGRAGDNVILSRLEACRGVAGDSFERFAEQSLALLRRACPVRRAGGASRLMAFRPDIAQVVSPRLAGEAREAARFLSSAREMARRLGRAEQVGAIIADAVDETRRYLGDLVVEIRASEGEERTKARRIMEQAISIAEPLLDEAELGVLKERARAAALTA